MLSEEIKKLIDQRDFDILFNGKHSRKHVKHVDFFEKSEPEDMFKNKYVIYMSRNLPSRNDPDLICLFPQLSNPKRQVIDAKSYYLMSSFNKDINENMKETPSDLSKPVFAVAYGNHVYVCKHITGTVYIYWTKYINQINAGKVANTPYKRVPLVMNYDGHDGPKGIYILRTQVKHENDLHRLPIAPGNPLVMQDGPMFNCEVQIQQKQMFKMMTLTERDAVQLSTYQTKNAQTWLPYEENVFRQGKGGGGFVVDNDDDDEDYYGEVGKKPSIMITKESIDHSLGFEEDVSSQCFEERDPFDDTNREEEQEEEKSNIDVIDETLTDPMLIV